jgi:hypothetical protein
MERMLWARCKPLRNARVVNLGAGLAMVPVTEELVAEFGGEKKSAHAGFEFLTPAMAAWAQKVSEESPLAYLQAGFFAEQGTQSAIVWKEKKAVLGPMHTGNAINQALKMMGVAPAAGSDEFDTVGLGRHRDTYGWLKDAS